MSENHSPSKKVLLKRMLHLGIVMAFATVLGVVAIRVIMSQWKKEHIPIAEEAKAQNVKSRSRQGAYMLLKNLNFRLTDEIQMKVVELEAEAIPGKGQQFVNFDDVNSFRIEILNGEAFVPTQILETIFSKTVFNYDGAPLKNLKMEFIDVEVGGKNEKRLKLSGDMKLVVWLGFEMTGKMLLDRENTLMVIEAEKIKSLGNPATKTMLDMVGLDLEKLLPVPTGRGITMTGNKIIVEPFKIFPPPKISGFITDLQMQADGILLRFSNKYKIKFPPLPVKDPKNFLFVYQGDVKFGKLRMIDAKLQMIDMDQKDDFDFYLKKYLRPLARGYSKIQTDGSVVAYIPDFNDTF